MRAPDDRADRRIQAILAATLRLLGTEGIAAVTHRRVAAEAGVPLGSTTYYFRSKNDLLISALQHAEAEDLTRLEGIGDQLARTTTPQTLAAEIVRLLLDEAMYPDPTPIITQFELLVAAVRMPELRTAGGHWDQACCDAVAAGFAAAGSASPELDARIVMANVYGHQARILRATDARVAIDEASADITRLVVGLLAAGIPPAAANGRKRKARVS
jgi:DNA-binding transcriptional regulator YbjK